MKLGKAIFMSSLTLLSACTSSTDAEYCALRKEMTTRIAEAVSGAANGTMPLKQSAEIMKEVNEKAMPRLEELEKKLPRDFTYKKNCDHS